MALFTECYYNKKTGDLFTKMWITAIKNSEQYFKDGVECKKEDLVGSVVVSEKRYGTLLDKKRAIESETIARDTKDMIVGIDQFGKVVQCQRLGGKFHVKITDGFDIKMVNTFGLMKIILDKVGDEFPIIDMQQTDTDLFHLVLKPTQKIE